MSHRIVYEQLAVIFPKDAMKAAVNNWQLEDDDRYMLLELGGDNNRTTFHPETNREVVSRDWDVLAFGRHHEVVEAAVGFSANCESGCMRLSGQRRTLPETYIRRVRNHLANPIRFDELGGLGLAVVADLPHSVPNLGEDAREDLQRYSEPAESHGKKLWRLHPLRRAGEAAVLMLYGRSVPGPAWNVAAASGPRFPCEGKALFHRLRAGFSTKATNVGKEQL